MDERKNLYEKTLSRDPLTQLYTRYFLHQNFPAIIEEAREKNAKLGILMLDIDNFKGINDTYGHLKGDEVLKKVAEVLRKSVRVQDIVVRYAGDEFLVILKEIDETKGKFIGERIVKEISKISITKKVKITTSAGLAFYPQDAQTPQELIDKADKALYLSKEKGKNRLSLTQEVTQEAISKEEVSKLFPTKNFIDRRLQLRKLKEVLKNTLLSKMSIVLIKGKLGIGKTRLLTEFEKYAVNSQIFSLRIIAQEKRMLQPYYGLSEALEEFLKTHQVFLSGLESCLPPEEIEALAELLPSFKEFAPKSIQKDTEEFRLSVFKGFRDIFVHLSQFQGLVLCFDDIQWLDKASFRLIDYFIENEFIRKIMICCTLNEEELKEEAPCKEFLSLPKKNIDIAVIELSPFSLQDIKEMVLSIFPQIAPSEEFYQSIFEITEGNPLFIEEMLKYLVESGIIFYRDNKWQICEISREEIPSSLEEVLQRRFRKLDPETKEFLAQAVIIGKDFQLDFLRQVVKKDLGYLFELIDRAKKKGFIETKKLDAFDFLNPLFQKVIYNELNPSERLNLHKKIAQIIEESYKDKKTQNILQELTYHYEKMGDTSKAHEYKDLIEKETLKFFDPQEIASYLEEISTQLPTEEIPLEVRIKKVERGIKEGNFEKVVEFLRWVSAALKNIVLYPEGNQIREDSIGKAYHVLIELLKDVSSLTFNEVEGILIINGQRLPSRFEKIPFVKNFISAIIEREIKGIQFLPELKKEELGIFLSLLSQKREELKKKGGIGQILKERGIKGIKIDTAHYERIATQQRLQPLEDNIMRLALLGILSEKKKVENIEELVKWINTSPQVLAQTLREIAKNFVSRKLGKEDFSEEAKFIVNFIQKVKRIISEQAPEYKEDLAKLISHLDASTKAYLLSEKDSPLSKEKEMLEKVAGSLSNEEIVEMIINASKSGEGALLYMRELFDKFVFSKSEKEEIVSLLKRRLSKIGLSEGEISFVIHKDYNALPLKEKIDALLKIPPSGYGSIGVENIKEVLDILIENSQKEELEKLIDKFLFYLEKNEPSHKEVVFKILNGFLGVTSLQQPGMESFVAKIISTLEKEILNLESPFYELALRVLELAIKWCYKCAHTPLSKDRWIIHLRFGYLNRLIESIYKALNTKSTTLKVEKNKESLRLFVFKLLDSDLIETLIFELADPSLEHTETIENILLKFSPAVIKKVISIVISKTEFTFEGYLYRKKVSQILKKIGEEAIEELRDFLLKEKEPPKLIRLIEIVSFLQEESLVEALSNFAEHPDQEVKKAVISALANVGGEKTKDVLYKMSKSPDPWISSLAAEKMKIIK